MVMNFHLRDIASILQGGQGAIVYIDKRQSAYVVPGLWVDPLQRGTHASGEGAGP